jgi:hypothetical protein
MSILLRAYPLPSRDELDRIVTRVDVSRSGLDLRQYVWFTYNPLYMGVRV